VREGLGSVVAAAARGLPLQLGTPVTQLDWSGAQLRLTTPAGTLEARSVIVTLPTTVLAAGGLRFLPELPAAYGEAFEALPLGSCNKVFFRFDETALPPDTRHCLAHADSSRTAHFCLRPAGQPLVMAYFGGDLSRELEQQGALASYARDELQRLFGAALAGRIRGTLSTAWDADPWARGCYASARPGAASQRQQLALPVTPRLVFAGEACHAHHYGTIYGAYQSGVAAATSLLHTLRTSP
jgi:monoamine oxidase